MTARSRDVRAPLASHQQGYDVPQDALDLIAVIADEAPKTTDGHFRSWTRETPPPYASRRRPGTTWLPQPGAPVPDAAAVALVAASHGVQVDPRRDREAAMALRLYQAHQYSVACGCHLMG